MRPTEKQRDSDNDYNDNKTKEGGSPKKKKKAARKATELKEAKGAKGAAIDHDEAVVQFAVLVLERQRTAVRSPAEPARRCCAEGRPQ
jgi:hypothetical protein